MYRKVKVNTYTTGNKAFNAYYKDLYNIREDKNTYQPSQKEILDFLEQANLPSISLLHYPWYFTSNQQLSKLKIPRSR